MMSSKLFVGNLPFKVDKAQLESAFAPFGKVTSTKVIIDRKTNRSRGYGFVEYATQEEAEAAIKAMNESDMGGRTLTVSLAKTQE